LKKLSKEYAKGKVYIEQIIKEQEGIVKVAEKGKEEVKKRLLLLYKLLKKYVESEDWDEKGLKAKREYERVLVRRTILEKTIQVATESIERAKLNMI